MAVVKDNEEPATWYRKVAEQGYAMAQCNLGSMYADALEGGKTGAALSQLFVYGVMS